MFSSEKTLWTVCLFLVSLFLFRIWLKKKFSYWSDRGVKQWKANSIFGNFGSVMKGGNEADVADECYEVLGDVKYGGYYFFWKPVLLIKDPELIKTITIKDFDAFANHPDICNVKQQPDAVLNSLFFMKNAEWKAKRTAMSHFFTPRRLKLIHSSIEQFSRDLFPIFDRYCSTGESLPVETTLNSMTMNIITSTFIGVNLNEQEKFVEAAQMFSFPSNLELLKMALYNINPAFNRTLGLASINNKIWDIFSSFVSQVVTRKENDNSIGSDLFGFLIKCKQGGVKGFEDICLEEMVGHVFSFFIAGHDTTALTISFMLYELSQHPNVQSKLREEIQKSVQESEGLTFETLKTVTYLNQVLQETIRRYPVLGVIKRVSTRTYKIDENLTIPKNTEIIIPVRALHNDPKYFAEPEKFLPERFAEGTPETLLAFGKGPRICIGKKFAEVVIKMAIAIFICNYEILPSNKNHTPFKYEPSVVVTTKPVNGVWIRLKRISDC